MNPSVRRAFGWIVLVLASLVVLGVFVQVYVIAAYIFSGASDTDALDFHADVGGVVHGVELLVLVAAIVACWKAWKGVVAPLALAVVGTAQIAFVEGGEEWVNAFHGLLALVVLILAHAVAVRALRDLGLGRHGGSTAGTP